MSSNDHDSPTFPAHTTPRIWLITAGDCPVGSSLIRHLLIHGDVVVCGIHPPTVQHPDFLALLDEAKAQESWRLTVLPLDIRLKHQCQSIVAETKRRHGRIDVLLICTSVCVLGTIEEFSTNECTQSLIKEQFATNFDGAANMIMSSLPLLREKSNGHIIVLSAITGHLGTPGLGIYCASQWAIEGYCDSLMYEIAPFNIRLSIVQPSIEVTLLTNKVISVPPHPAYASDVNGAPLFRDILAGLLDADKSADIEETSMGDLLYADGVTSFYPLLKRPDTSAALVEETVHAIVAIGGHSNPPSRHIVGNSGVTSVKEKLKTVSEELEEFVECSLAVDVST